MSYTYVTVGVDKDYQTVQAGIDAAAPGNVVLIDPGVYEETLMISKLVHLRGKTNTPEDRSVVIKDFEDDALYTLRIENASGGSMYIEAIEFRHHYTAWYAAFLCAAASSSLSLYINRCLILAGDSQHCFNFNLQEYSKLYIEHCYLSRGYSHVLNTNWGSIGDGRIYRCELNNEYNEYQCTGTPGVLNYVTASTPTYGPAYGDFYIPLIFTVEKTAASITVSGTSGDSDVKSASPTEGELFLEPLADFNLPFTSSEGSLRIRVRGGVLPLTWGIAGPGTGFRLASSFARENTAYFGSSGTFVITVTDAYGRTTSINISVCIETICCSDSEYSFVAGSAIESVIGIESPVFATGGCPPYTWSFVGGDLVFSSIYTNLPNNKFMVDAGEEGKSITITCTDSCLTAVNMVVTVAPEAAVGDTTEIDMGTEGNESYVYRDEIGIVVDWTDWTETGWRTVGYRLPPIALIEGDSIADGTLYPSKDSGIPRMFSELLLNGSMEINDCWTTISGTCERSNTEVYEGSYSWKLSVTVPATQAEVISDIWELANKYSMKIDLYFYATAACDLYISICDDISGDSRVLKINYDVLPIITWTRVTFPATISSNWDCSLDIIADFSVVGGTGIVYIDKASVESELSEFSYSNGIANGAMNTFSVWEPGVNTIISRRSSDGAKFGSFGWLVSGIGSEVSVAQSVGTGTLYVGHIFAYVFPISASVFYIDYIADDLISTSDNFNLVAGKWNVLKTSRIARSGHRITLRADSSFYVDNVGII